MYDAGGKLFRLSANYFNAMFNGEGMIGNATYYLDLNTGGYAPSGLGGQTGAGWWSNKVSQSPYTFSPEALAGEGIR